MSGLSLAAGFPAATEAQWREAVARALKGGTFEKLISRSAETIDVRPLYPKGDGPVIAKAAPGPWRILQRVDHPDPEAANAQALADLEGGADALALVFSGAPSARGFGLSVEDVAGLERALDRVAIDLIALRLETAPFDGRAAAAMMTALAARQGLPPSGLDIDFGLDPLGDFAAAGESPLAVDDLLARAAGAATDLRARGYATARFFRADARRVHEAGGGEAQELSWLLAVGVAGLRALEKHGVATNEARRFLSFTLAVDDDQFLTIAKCRALRLLWARIEQACGLKAEPLRLHAETAWRMMAKRDAETNMLRATIAAFSAGIGGADSIAVTPFTAALGLTDAFARRVARNLQHVLIAESHLAKVVDPAAGAGGFEALTNALCEKAWALFQEIESEGGMFASLAAGKFQERVGVVRAAREKAAATRRSPLTGVSDFAHLGEKPPAVPGVTAPPARRELAPGPAPLDFGELVDHFRDGGARFARGAAAAAAHCEPLPSRRLAEPFEELRDASDERLAKTGARPRIFLACLGAVADFSARALFAKSFFESGGIETLSNDGFAQKDGATDLPAMTDAFRASGASLACLCSSEEIYAREALDAAMALGAGGARRIALAGRPGGREAVLRAAGLSLFVFAGCDALETLREALRDA